MACSCLGGRARSCSLAAGAPAWVQPAARNGCLGDRAAARVVVYGLAFVTPHAGCPQLSQHASPETTKPPGVIIGSSVSAPPVPPAPRLITLLTDFGVSD